MIFFDHSGAAYLFDAVTGSQLAFIFPSDGHDRDHFGISIAIAFTIATVLHITVGEQVPKMVAINRAEGTSRLVAPPLHAFRVISAPFTWGLSVASNAMVRLFGVDPERIEEHHDADDLRSLILTSGSQGDIEENEATNSRDIVVWYSRDNVIRRNKATGGLETTLRQLKTPSPPISTIPLPIPTGQTQGDGA